MNKSEAWNDVHHILCVRLDNMGDVLMSTPAIRALRASGRRITLLTSTSAAALQPHLPDVDEVLSYDASWVKRDACSVMADRAAIERISACQPDAAVIFTVYSQSALPAAMMCRLAGVPRVLAYSRENPYQLISDWVREPEPEQLQRHEVARQLALVSTITAPIHDNRMQFRVRDVDRQNAREKLSARGVTEAGGWIAVHGGASAPSRRYPAALLAQVIHGLRGEGRRILILGGTEDEALAGEIASRRHEVPGLLDFSGQLTLGELGAVLEAAGVLVCNNSGPAHIASALGVPVVDLYALTNPQHTPWRTPNRVLNHAVPCANCYRSVCPRGDQACLAGVPPSRVVDAARELLVAS